MKKLISLLLCLALLLSIAPTMAAQQQTEPTEPAEPPESYPYSAQVGALEYQVYEDHAEVKAVCDRETEYDIFSIEESVDGKPVTAIGFLGMAGLKARGIIIPNTVTKLCGHAFDIYVQEIWMSQNITEIEFSAFDSCDSLRLLYWPDNANIFKIETNNCSWHDALFAHCCGPYFVTNTNSRVYDFVQKTGFRYLPITDGIEYLTDGVGVYSTDGKTASMHAMYYDLYADAPNEYFMPDTICDIPITNIEGDAFFGKEMHTLYLGKYVQTIESGAFVRSNLWELFANENLQALPHPLFGGKNSGVVYGFAGSYAERFCAEQGYQFYPIDAVPFKDVEKSDWFYDAVYFCYLTGLMNGTSGTSFAPNATTTRAMLVQVLYNMSGTPAVDTVKVFDDVQPTDWYSDAVTFCKMYGLANGTSETTFSPNQNVTREQVATFLCRYAAACDIEIAPDGEVNQFADVGRISAYAMDAMRWAVGNGIINGQTPTTLNPQGYATRAEIATMLMRFILYVDTYLE